MVPTLHIHLLGEFRLSAGDTPVTTLDQERLQALLAYLVLQRATPHSRRQLAFQLWPDSTEAQARTNLRSLIHRLRQALPDADAFLHIDAQMVQWRADAPCTLDVAAFEQALARAAQAGQRGDQTAARSALQEAVDLYRGDLLPGWYDDWVLLERERLRQAFLAVLERLIVLLEHDQEYAVAIEHAQQLLRLDPLHEATYQYLMRLHALSGDRASAVRAYQTCVIVLERELGVEPSPATREAYERSLHLEAAAAAVEHPAGPSPNRQHHNLPLALTSFVGRATERAEVTSLLTGTRLLTLTGAGGCGKTRLALTVATDLVTVYHDGVWLVELASLADEALVPQAAATVLGVQEQAQRPLTATLVDALQSRDMLLVLDNCEHLIDACAHLAQILLVGCPQLRILATSREALGIAGETTWLVPSLPLPDRQQLPPVAELAQVEAVRLFVERAAAVLPTFTLTRANAAAIAQICWRLDGIPLAIELAAARIKVLAVDQLATRLDHAMHLLTSGSRTALPRQQTLRAAIDWSYDLLAAPEQAVFQRLSVFAGGWTLEAAETVCVGHAIAADDVLELLAHLVDKSVVVVEPPHEGQVRYRLLEPMRQYAQEKLREAGETEATQQHHGRFFLALAEQAEQELKGPDQLVWRDRLVQEHDNLRAAVQSAIERGDRERAVRLSGALVWFWSTYGYLSEGRKWLDLTLAHSADVPAAVRAKALIGAGELMAYCGDDNAAHALYEEGLALSRRLGDERGIAGALNGLGNMMYLRGELVRAKRFYEESLVLSRAAEDKWGMATTLGNLGSTAWREGNPTAARALYEESLSLFRELGDKQQLAWALLGLGEAARYQDDSEKATLHFAESLAIFQSMGPIRWGVARVLHGLGHVAHDQCDEMRAKTFFEESLIYWREAEEKRGIAHLLNHLGHTALQRGDFEQATIHFMESLALQREMAHSPGLAECLEALASLAGARRQSKRAARLFGAAAALRNTKPRGDPAHDAEYNRNIATARAQLDDVTWEIAWAEGQALPLEQAIAEALHVADALPPYIGSS